MYSTQKKLSHAKALVGAVSLLLAGGVMANPALAETPKEKAQAHNAAYEWGASFGRSPVEMSTMLLCSSLWGHWYSIVSSAQGPAFTAALRPELTSEYAKNRQIYLERLARRKMDEDDGMAEFEDMRSSTAEMASRAYDKYLSGKKGSVAELVGWLGEC